MKKWFLVGMIITLIAPLAAVSISQLSASETRNYQVGWANVGYAGESGPIAERLPTLIEASSIIYHFDNSTGRFERYIPGNPSLSNFANVEKGEGYLVLLTQPTSIEIPSCPDTGSSVECPSPTPCLAPTACPTPAGSQCEAELFQCQANLSARDTAFAEMEALFWECDTSFWKLDASFNELNSAFQSVVQQRDVCLAERDNCQWEKVDVCERISWVVYQYYNFGLAGDPLLWAVTEGINSLDNWYAQNCY